jgi:hypothetical protein
LAAYAGKNAELAENQHIDVDRLIVSGEVSITIGTCGVTLDVKNDVFFVFEPAGVLENDQ